MHFKGTFVAFEWAQKMMLVLDETAMLLNDAFSLTSIYH